MPEKTPPLRKQAWNLSIALANFVADGCTTVNGQMWQAARSSRIVYNASMPVKITKGCEYERVARR